jgi:hypothetical protein
MGTLTCVKKKLSHCCLLLQEAAVSSKIMASIYKTPQFQNPTHQPLLKVKISYNEHVISSLESHKKRKKLFKMKQVASAINNYYNIYIKYVLFYTLHTTNQQIKFTHIHIIPIDSPNTSN